MLLTISLLIGFVLTLTVIIALSKKALEVIFTYEMEKTDIKETASHDVMVSLNDMVANLQANKEIATGKINTATNKEIQSIQDVIEQRAFELKQMLVVKRSLEAKQAENRAAKLEAFKLKKRMQIAEIYAQNRTILRLRDMALTV